MQTACCNINENQIFMKCQFQCQCFPCSYFEANNQNYKAEFETNNIIIFNDSNDSKKMTKMIFILILIILVKQILLKRSSNERGLFRKLMKLILI